MTAIAGRLGIDISLSRLNELSDTTPVLVNHKPVGAHYMEDFHFAGGLGVVLRELKPLLNLDCRTVTGETLGERLEAPLGKIDRNVIASAAEPIEPEGGLVALFGNLAPRGAILKRSAADSSLFEKTGRAVVFTSLEDLASCIDDPDKVEFVLEYLGMEGTARRVRESGRLVNYYPEVRRRSANLLGRLATRWGSMEAFPRWIPAGRSA